MVERFIDFVTESLSEEERNFDSPQEFDDMIKEFRTEAELSRSQHANLVAGVEFFLSLIHI